MKTLLAVGFSVLVLIGCMPLYHHTPHNTPMFTGKNQAQATANVSNAGFNGQGAFAVTDHLAVAVNGSYLHEKDADYFNRLLDVEVIAGYYTNFDAGWSLEVFGGTGGGNTSGKVNSIPLFLWLTDSFEFDARYKKIFLQPSVGLRDGRFLWNLSAKLNHVKFTKAKTISGAELKDYGKPDFIFIEPGLKGSTQLFRSRFFWSFEVGTCFPMGYKPSFEYEPIILSTGLMFRLEGKR